MNENIQIRENTCKTSNAKIRLYKEIFWAEPWNEWFICKSCWKILPKTFYWKCTCWETDKFEPFYKNKELKESLASTVENFWYREFVADILSEDVWFIWGWQTTLSQLNDCKLWLSEDDFKRFSQVINQIFPDFDFESVYYLAEIWVKNTFRWKSIAWELYRENIRSIEASWVTYIVVRTTKKSNIPYKWFLREWYQEVFLYNDEQERVILVKKL